MPRRKAVPRRETLPDPLYGSERLARFINVVMREGKRSIAEKIVYGALQEASRRMAKKAKPSQNEEDGKSGEDGSGGKSSTGSSKGKKVSDQIAMHSAEKDVLGILDKALVNIRPSVEVKSRRVGGATYQVPIEVGVERGTALAMRWIIKTARTRGEKTMILRLAGEMLEACEGKGASVKMRDDMHKMAKANQAFAHYRW
jgi:small subunit ribosomal protein S7